MKNARFCTRKCHYEYTKKQFEGKTCIGPRGYVYEHYNGELKGQHVVVAEKALGKRLPQGAEVHHFDKNRSNNNPSNLVICQNSQYHILLHLRAEIIQRGGNPLTDKVCYSCDKALSRSEFWKRKKSTDGLSFICKDCYNKARRPQHELE